MGFCAFLIFVMAWFPTVYNAEVQTCNTYEDCLYCKSPNYSGCNCDWALYNNVKFQPGCLSRSGIYNIQSYTCYTSTVGTDGYMVYSQCPKNTTLNVTSVITTTTTKPRNPDNQFCNSYVDCSYCPSIYASGCSCDWLLYNNYVNSKACLSSSNINIEDFTCFFQENIAGTLVYKQCPKYNKTSTTMMPTTTTQVTTSTTSPYTTTLPPQTTEISEPPPNIPPLVKLDINNGEYCTRTFQGFDSMSFRIFTDSYLNEPTYSNKRGCNGTVFAIQSIVTYKWYGWACPWELNKGCSMEFNGDYYYLLCATGCYNKSQCTSIPANAYYTTPGNCDYDCLSNFQMLSNGTCVPSLQHATTSNTPEQTTTVTSFTLQQTSDVFTTTMAVPTSSCTSYSQCSSCPSKKTYGCAQISIVQRDANGNALTVISSYTPPNMVQYKCVYQEFSLNQWYYCLVVDVTTQTPTLQITSTISTSSTTPYFTSTTSIVPTYARSSSSSSYSTTVIPATTMPPYSNNYSTTAIPASTVPPPSMLPSIQPLSKVMLGPEEYCLSFYNGFDASAFKLQDNTPIFSNTKGCNGSWFAKLNDWNQWTGFVCPWEINKGCNVISNNGYYVVCDSGCYSKATCTTCGTGAYEIVPCTTTSNRVCAKYELNITPSNDSRTCLNYSDCDHCPRVGYLGLNDFNVWGCAGHDVRLSFLETYTQTFTSTYALMANHCVYYTNATYAMFCPECFPCPTGTYETAPCTNTTNRVCTNCTECNSTMYETSPCTNTTNRVCNARESPTVTSNNEMTIIIAASVTAGTVAAVGGVLGILAAFSIL